MVIMMHMIVMIMLMIFFIVMSGTTAWSMFMIMGAVLLQRTSIKVGSKRTDGRFLGDCVITVLKVAAVDLLCSLVVVMVLIVLEVSLAFDLERA